MKSFKGKVYLSSINKKKIKEGNKVVHWFTKEPTTIFKILLLNGDDAARVAFKNQGYQNLPLSTLGQYKVLEHGSLTKWCRDKSPLKWYYLCEQNYSDILVQGQQIEFYLTENNNAAFTDKYKREVHLIKLLLIEITDKSLDIKEFCTKYKDLKVSKKEVKKIIKNLTQ